MLLCFLKIKTRKRISQKLYKKELCLPILESTKFKTQLCLFYILNQTNAKSFEYLLQIVLLYQIF
jgi:hypothetical protein